MWHFFSCLSIHHNLEGGYGKMNEERKSEIDKKIAGIYIRVSTEEQARERI